MTTAMFDTNRARMIEFISRGAVNPGAGFLGFELESFVVTRDEQGQPAQVVTYESSPGVRDILERFAQRSDLLDLEPIHIDGHLMGLSCKVPLPDLPCPEQNPASQPGQASSEPHSAGLEISLEPASQFEISVGPVRCLDDLPAVYSVFSQAFQQTARELGLDADLMQTGYNPLHNARSMPLIDKERYRLMDAHFKNTGNSGIDMMRGTASTQVSFDFVDEQDFVRKYRMANALAPLLSLATDNVASFRGSLTGGAPRMAHARVWQDVDPARCGLVPGTFDPGFGFAAYVDWVLSAPAILFLEPDGTVRGTQQPMAELIANTAEPLTKDQIAHLFSMVFPDVRVKNFIEFRDADSLPIHLGTALTALIKGIMYNRASFQQAYELLGIDSLGDKDILEARQQLMDHGYTAQIYGGQNAGELLDKLLDIARAGLPAREQHWLETPGHNSCTGTAAASSAPASGTAASAASTAPADPDSSIPAGIRPVCSNADAWTLPGLIAARTTLRGQLWLPRLMTAAADEYHGILASLNGDVQSRRQTQDYLDHSHARRNGRTIDWLATPKIIPAADVARIRDIAQTTGRIMLKATRAYLENPAFRALLEPAPELARLIDTDPGYETCIPLSRVDIFYNEQTKDFKFCEINTDGSSGTIFTLELNRAIPRTAAFREFASRHTLREFEIFDSWVSTFMEVYQGFVNAVPNPRVAIVDYPESLVAGDRDNFLAVFARHGVDCRFADIRGLTYDAGAHVLRADDGGRIDAIWRRAVTSETLAKPCAGAEALLAAMADHAVCAIGSFRTQPAGSKNFLALLASDAGAQVLDPDEHAFIRQHMPRTFDLDSNTDLTDALKAPGAWIVKPRDGYGGRNVLAGIDFVRAGDKDGWEKALRACAAEDAYILQEFVAPYASSELPGALPDGPGASTAGAGTDSRRGANLAFEPLGNLMGLYLYKGVFKGVYMRYGRNGVISAGTGQLNGSVFMMDDHNEFPELGTEVTAGA